MCRVAKLFPLQKPNKYMRGILLSLANIFKTLVDKEVTIHGIFETSWLASLHYYKIREEPADVGSLLSSFIGPYAGDLFLGVSCVSGILI